MSAASNRRRALRRRGYLDGLADRQPKLADKTYLDAFQHGQLAKERDEQAAWRRKLEASK